MLCRWDRKIRAKVGLDILRGFRYDFLAMSTASVIRTQVERADPGAIFTLGDFGGSRRAVESALSRLATKGTLLRVRNGVYWKGMRSRFGSGRPRMEEVALKVAGHRGAGPTGWSASHDLGLSTQVPPVPEFVVVGMPPTGLRDVTFHSRRNVARVGLNYFEIAVLEILRNWPEYVEVSWPELVRRIKELRDERKISLESVHRAAALERSKGLHDRIHDLLSELITTAHA